MNEYPAENFVLYCVLVKRRPTRSTVKISQTSNRKMWSFEDKIRPWISFYIWCGRHDTDCQMKLKLKYPFKITTTDGTKLNLSFITVSLKIFLKTTLWGLWRIKSNSLLWCAVFEVAPAQALGTELNMRLLRYSSPPAPKSYCPLKCTTARGM